jgi:hypothetical protein
MKKNEKLKKISLLLLLTGLVLLYGCKPKWQLALENTSKRLLHGNNPNDWTLSQEFEDKFSISYTVQKIDYDTLKILDLIISKKEGDVFINRYVKSFRCNDRDTCNLEMNSQDTLFFYKQNGKKKIFEVA